MFIILGILIISAFIIYVELPSLKKGGAKTIWAFSILLIMGLTLNMAIILNATIISPLDVIIYIFQPISDFLKTTLLK
ncbi:hypothetical protein ACMGD3_17955 [Lysinibacillus sphaericus]|uniref:hypothetical protein n=1 Tax=Lysinibacillus sphaericus TaxID=1421 RepID=UPI001C603744